MAAYDALTIDQAPEAAKPLLAGAQQKLGFLPNLYATMANAPAVLQGFLSVSDAFSKTSFKPREQQLILIAASAENGCEYCVAAHSTIATALRTDEALLGAARAGQPLPDPRLDALVTFTRDVVRERGFVNPAQIEAFLSAGWSREQLLEVLLGVTMKTLSNYFNHINDTELDGPFQAQVWSASDRG